jgi:hypothetical protein
MYEMLLFASVVGRERSNPSYGPKFLTQGKDQVDEQKNTFDFGIHRSVVPRER